MVSQTHTGLRMAEALSKQAFDFAVARWQKGSALDEGQLEQVRQLQVQLRQLAEQLRHEQPKLDASVSDTISEGLLDLKYALTAPLATSLRLHHYIDSQTKAS